MIYGSQSETLVSSSVGEAQLSGPNRVTRCSTALGTLDMVKVWSVVIRCSSALGTRPIGLCYYLELWIRVPNIIRNIVIKCFKRF